MIQLNTRQRSNPAVSPVRGESQAEAPQTTASPTAPAQAPAPLSAAQSERLGAVANASPETSRPGQQGQNAARAGFFRSFVEQHDMKDLVKKGAIATGAVLAATASAATVVGPAVSNIVQTVTTQTVFDMGNTTLIDQIDSDQLASMSQEQLNARKLLHTLARDCGTAAKPATPEEASAREVAARLIKIGSPTTSETPQISVNVENGTAVVTQEVRLTPEMTAKIAAHFDKLGLPMDAEGVQAFMNHRGLESKDGAFTGSIARAYADALAGNQLLVDVPAKLTPQQRGALDLLQSLNSEHRAALLDKVNYSQTLEGDLATQAKKLDNEVIDLAMVDKVATRFEKVGIPLNPRSVENFFDQRGLPDEGGADITRKDANRLVRGLEGDQMVWAHGKLDGDQKAAKELLEALGPRGREALYDLVNAQEPKTGNLALQNRKLDNEIITEGTLNKIDRRADRMGENLREHGQIGKEEGKTLLQHLKTIGKRPTTQAAKVDWYRRIVESQGHTFREGVNQVNIVALRGYDVENGRNPNQFGKFNDTISFVWKGKDGHWNVREYRGTTEPGLTGGSYGTDVNGDGVGDIAHARPGQYPYRVGYHKGVYGAGNPEINVPVYRDTSHNGYISAAEKAASIRRGDVGYGINLHWSDGYSSSIGYWSAGCQVIHMSQSQFRQRITPILELNEGQMYLSIVDMRGVP